MACFRKRVTPETVPRGFIDVNAGQALFHVEISDLFSTHLWGRTGNGAESSHRVPRLVRTRIEVGSPEEKRERPKKWDRLTDDGPT